MFEAKTKQRPVPQEKVDYSARQEAVEIIASVVVDVQRQYADRQLAVRTAPDGTSAFFCLTVGQWEDQKVDLLLNQDRLPRGANPMISREHFKTTYCSDQEAADDLWIAVNRSLEQSCSAKAI